MRLSSHRIRSVILSVLVALAVGMSATPAMAKKKHKAVDPDKGGLYIPAGPVAKRGIVLGNLDAPEAPASMHVSGGNPEDSALKPTLYRVMAIASMQLHSLFE